MNSKVSAITETAWNLYRALRTYPTVQRAIENARTVLPQRGQVYLEPIKNDDGTDRLNDDGTVAMYEETQPPVDFLHATISHARAIVLYFALAEPTTDPAFNKWGIRVLTECIAHEIEHGTAATREQCEGWYTGSGRHLVRYSDRTHTPFIGGLHDLSSQFNTPEVFAYITFNLAVYESREDFIKHATAILPDMYDRLNVMRNEARLGIFDAYEKAAEEWRRQAKIIPPKVTRIVKERGVTALFGHLKDEEWQGWEARKREYEWDKHIVPPHYDHPAPQKDKSSGLTEEEWQFYWHFCRLDPDGTCRVCITQISIGFGGVAAPSRLLRGRYLPRKRSRKLADFHHHTQWWAAFRIEGKSYREIAKAVDVSHTSVRSAILRLEKEFMLTDETGAS